MIAILLKKGKGTMTDNILKVKKEMKKITKRRSLNFYRTEQYANAAEAL